MQVEKAISLCPLCEVFTGYASRMGGKLFYLGRQIFSPKQKIVQHIVIYVFAYLSLLRVFNPNYGGKGGVFYGE